mgnify:CR=1 FL=1
MTAPDDRLGGQVRRCCCPIPDDQVGRRSGVITRILNGSLAASLYRPCWNVDAARVTWRQLSATFGWRVAARSSGSSRLCARRALRRKRRIWTTPSTQTMYCTDMAARNESTV